MDEESTTRQEIPLQPITSSPSLELFGATAALRVLEEIFSRATDSNTSGPEPEGVSYMLGAIAGRLEGVANDKRVAKIGMLEEVTA